MKAKTKQKIVTVCAIFIWAILSVLFGVFKQWHDGLVMFLLPLLYIGGMVGLTMVINWMSKDD